MLSVSWIIQAFLYDDSSEDHELDSIFEQMDDVEPYVYRSTTLRLTFPYVKLVITRTSGNEKSGQVHLFQRAERCKQLILPIRVSSK